MEFQESKIAETSLSQLQALIIAGAPKPDHCVPFAVLPEGYKLNSLEQLLEKPNRIKGTVNLLTSDSFIQYIKRFVDPRTVIFADQPRIKFTAIIDYHETNADPEWAEHKAIYACPLSDQWKEWVGKDKKSMDQLEFAEFIELHISDIAPADDDQVGFSGAQLLEMVLAFQETRKSEFKSVRRIHDGTFQFAYSDEKGGGNTSLPEKIRLAIPPFHNGLYYALEAKLRYRLRDGDLTLWYELIEPKAILEAAFKAVMKNIQDGLPEQLVIEAVAP